MTNQKSNEILNNKEKYKDLLKLHPNGRTTIKGRKDISADIIHEIGHAIAKSDEYLYKEFESYVNSVTKQYDYIFDKAPYELSLYASSNESEFFAESFADCIINDDKASEAGRCMLSFLKAKNIVKG